MRRGLRIGAVAAMAIVALTGSARVASAPAGEQAGEPQAYPFYPQAGTPWKDILFVNFTDLDKGPGIQDWSCSTYTYDGHNGHDSSIIGFGHQEVGVPVYAALDGTVIELADGKDDRNTEGSPDAYGNYVVIDHGNTHVSIYVHLKKGSVAVTDGQTVVAGTQLGLVGSSGNSTWPHLHFESEFNGAVYEPSAGECRPGQSLWIDQITIPTQASVADVALSDEPWEGRAGLPWDEGERSGTFVKGTSVLYPRVSVNNVPKRSTFKLDFVRPDGKSAFREGGSFQNSTVLQTGWYWWGYPVRLDRVGTWHLVVRVNNKRVLDAPFKVVARANQVVNRPPKGVQVRVDSTGAGVEDVLVCRVAKPTLIRDADYDLVSYGYVWKVGDTVLRELTSAALSDMLPRATAKAGDTVTCEVTPTDGEATATTSTAAFSP